jgi:hypothetical protein
MFPVNGYFAFLGSLFIVLVLAELTKLRLFLI